MSYISFNHIQYLKNYPDLKQAGIETCEQAWNHYLRFGKLEGRICNPIISLNKKVVFYKSENSFVIDFSNVIQKSISKQSITMYSSTPTILKVKDGYILNVRYVNYIIKKYDPEYSYSLNKYILLDNSFNKKKEYFFDYDFSKDLLKHKGLEDIKLFELNGIIYYTGNIFRNKKSCITFGPFNENYQINVINTKFNNNTAWEKNWALFNNHSIIGVVYKWNPLTVCEIKQNELLMVKEIEMPELFQYIRGSTNGFTFNNEIWFVTHINQNGEYFHLFVVFDLSMVPKRYSELFKFENCTVEFCLGLVLEPERIILSYSTMDSTSKILILEKLGVPFTNF
jgi:hypothetical protein